MAQCKFKHILDSLTAQTQYIHLNQSHVIKNDNGTSMEIHIFSFS